ncbi:MAG: nucleotide exchange factor GrpE [Patescibacteria group bacterium]
MEKDKQNKKEPVEDIVFESDNVEIAGEKGDALKRLRERLKTCEEEKNRYLTAWQKDKADFINARKDDDKRNLDLLKFSKENLLSKLIPVLDSFEMAMKNPSWENISKDWKMGVEYIHSQLQTVLEDSNLQAIDPLGKKFNPSEHHAVGVIETKDKEKDHVVLEVFQKGYQLNGKIVRPAQVNIGEYKLKN